MRDWSRKRDWEGGDTAHREGMWTALEGMLHPDQIFKLRNHFIWVIQKYLQHPFKPGLWRRHPDTKYYYGDWDRMSRDQMWEIILAMAVLKMEDELDEAFWHIFKRFGFMTNTRHNGAMASNHGDKAWEGAADLKWWEKMVIKYRIPVIPINKDYHNYNWKIPDFTGLGLWAVYFKFKIKKHGCKWWWSKTLVWLADLKSLGNTMIKVHFYGKNPDNSDDSNYIMPALYGKWLGTESWIAKFSRRYYFRNRPFAAPPNLVEYGVNNGPMSALRNYFDGNAWGRMASPPLDRLAEPLVNEMGD